MSADDNTTIISNTNFDNLCILSNKHPSQINEWFSLDNTTLNLDTAKVITITTNTSYTLKDQLLAVNYQSIISDKQEETAWF
jgi:hypothetical protein